MMSQHPDWLPALVLFKDSGNVWQDYLAVLYGWFRVDFVDSKPDWPGKRVGLKRKPLYDGKEATFWHFIQEGPEEAERMPDLRRCERIRWPRKVIDRFEEKNPSPEDPIVWWKNVRRGEDRYLLALVDFSYLVVVVDRGSYVLPWTAYYVEQEHRRTKLRTEFEAYWVEKG